MKLELDISFTLIFLIQKLYNNTFLDVSFYGSKVNVIVCNLPYWTADGDTGHCIYIKSIDKQTMTKIQSILLVPKKIWWSKRCSLKKQYTLTHIPEGFLQAHKKILSSTSSQLKFSSKAVRIKNVVTGVSGILKLFWSSTFGMLHL